MGWVGGSAGAGAAARVLWVQVLVCGCGHRHSPQGVGVGVDLGAGCGCVCCKLYVCRGVKVGPLGTIHRARAGIAFWLRCHAGTCGQCGSLGGL